MEMRDPQSTGLSHPGTDDPISFSCLGVFAGNLFCEGALNHTFPVVGMNDFSPIPG